MPAEMIRLRPSCLYLLCAILCVNRCQGHKDHGPGMGDSDGGAVVVQERPFANCTGTGASCDHQTPIYLVKWLSSLGAVTFIAVCSIFSVLVVPVMQKIFYQHLIQFLISLAVGSLLGDAFLHLLPHALLGNLHHHHRLLDDEVGHYADDLHNRAVYLGLAVLGAIFGFLVSERIINWLGEMRKRPKTWKKEQAAANLSDKDQPTSQLEGQYHEDEEMANGDCSPTKDHKKVKVIRSGHSRSSMAKGGSVCKHVYTTICPEKHEKVCEEDDRVAKTTKQSTTGRLLEKRNATCHTPLLLPALSDSHLLANGNGQSQQPKEDSAAVTDAAAATAPAASNSRISMTSDKESNSSPKMDHCDLEESVGGYKTVFVNQHEHVHHGHSHAHTHVLSAPDSISSVAWMVLIGDGIHSFADGMAVGAAFSESLFSGLSTSLAVLCHELPHKVGDFALFLRSGMSLKQAFVYNVLSTGVSYFGVVFGVLLGSLESLLPWIFAVTAGVFVYIALVDMIPEMNTGHLHPLSDDTQESPMRALFIQLLGLAMGVGIMLLIALYEHDLTTIFHEKSM